MAAAAGAQEPDAHGHAQRVVAPFVAETPDADGVLDEPLWENAAVVETFVQAEPDEGAPASQATRVRIALTENALLIGVVLDDPEPEAIVARQYRRDADLESDDNFMVVLDTYHDHRSAAFFSTNAVGTRQDGLIQNEGTTVTREWDGVWIVGSRRTATGWVAEIVIPFETLRFPSGTTEFGINFLRQVARTRELSSWAPIDNDWGFNAIWRVSAYGVVEGLEAARPGGRFKLKPAGVYGFTREDRERTSSFDGAFDAKVALGSNLNLDVTVNTDFAQVEADEQQVNLTRFELFFPEKREFFLENAGLFQVGEPYRPFEPPETLLFFSRRIGLSDDGDIVPILGGARVTGKLGATDVGAFHIRQDALEGASEATGFSAVRLRRDVLARSSVGVFALDKTVSGGDSHRVAAADFSWAWSDLSTVSGFAAISDTPGAEGRESAYSVAAMSGTDRWRLDAIFTDIGEGFESQLGFVPRTGVRKTKLDAMWTPRPGRFGIRQIFMGAGVVRFTETDGAIQSQSAGVGPYILFDDGGSLFFNVGRETEGLSESFELRDGVVIEEGTYENPSYFMMAESSQSRRLSVNLFALRNGFFDGTLRVIAPGFAIRPHPRVRFGLSYSRSDIRLPQPGGDFTTNLVILRGMLALSPDAFIRGLLQWNDDEGAFSGNLQLRWTWRPGSDFFLVYNDRRPYGLGSDVDVRRQLLMKATWYLVPG